MQKVSRSLAVILACLLLLNTTATTFASDDIMPLASSYIAGTYSNIIPQSGGKLLITFRVTAPAPMTSLGAASVLVYEDDGTGARWVKTIFPTDPDCENMLGSGTYHGSNVTYTGTPGYKYYAKVYLTAQNSTGLDTIPSTTPTVTAIP